MARRNWSMQDAKNRFSEVVEAARRVPQTVIKHGKPAVVVMDVAEYERLRHLERAQAPSFAVNFRVAIDPFGRRPGRKSRCGSNGSNRASGAALPASLPLSPGRRVLTRRLEPLFGE